MLPRAMGMPNSVSMVSSTPRLLSWRGPARETVGPGKLRPKGGGRGGGGGGWWGTAAAPRGGGGGGGGGGPGGVLRGGWGGWGGWGEGGGEELEVFGPSRAWRSRTKVSNPATRCCNRRQLGQVRRFMRPAYEFRPRAAAPKTVNGYNPACPLPIARSDSEATWGGVDCCRHTILGIAAMDCPSTANG